VEERLQNKIFSHIFIKTQHI